MSTPAKKPNATPTARPAKPKAPIERVGMLGVGIMGLAMAVNLMKAGSIIGINTVGSSLRNANLQVRSEPPNPQLNVGPWNNTTIAPDLMRVPLEIGCGGQ
jgi:hypothetical protein